MSRVSTTSGTTIFSPFFLGCASQKQALYHSISELTLEISQVRSEAAIHDIGVISRDLKQSNLKSDRFLKPKNSDFMACSGVPNPAPFTVKINIP